MTQVTILFAHYGLDWITGSERCLLDLVQHLDRRRFRPVVVCNSPTVAEAARHLGAVVYAGGEYASPDTRLPPRELVVRAKRIVAEQHVGLIHVNDFQPFKWLLPAARSARIPTVLHVHLPSTENERCHSWVHQASCIVGVSRFAIAGFIADGLRPDRTTVVYNGVDPARMAAGDARALRHELRIGDDEPVLVAAGSLIERKGIDTLIAAAAHLRDSGRDRFRLLLLGDGPERRRLESLVAARNLGRTVLFLGGRSDAAAVLRDAATIAVTAARQEAFPLNVIEAAYCGLPMVASDIPPHREALDNGRTGVIVPARDASAYATAIASLLDDPRRRAAMGRAASERVRRDFMFEGYLQRFTELYERLLAEPSSRYGWTGTWAWPAAYSRWITRVATKVARAAVPKALLNVACRKRAADARAAADS